MEQQMGKKIAFIDTEISPKTGKVMDIGAVVSEMPVNSVNGAEFHESSEGELLRFIKGCSYACGHNIVEFDCKYIGDTVRAAGISNVIDTLYWSPLLFPQKPYHRLLKNDKIQAEELNNPLNDAKKSMELFLDEVSAFEKLSDIRKRICFMLLKSDEHFNGLFPYLKYYNPTNKLSNFIFAELKGKICENVDLERLADETPVELAYCIAAIAVDDRESLLPYWVLKRYPKVQEVYRSLRNRPCAEGCPYCRVVFSARAQLKKKFGFDGFRSYGGEPLQERAVEAALQGKSLLAVFPTGGGKSLTFQLPALIAAETVKGLTVVISPLLSLMKDQVDHLSERGIADAVTINGLLNPVERAEAVERVEKGIASLLYIAPESLRSKTVERMLMGRNVVRFVIDEAHCFSAWGQDFRVDYLYIGKFIAMLQKKKQTMISVSCFTATAKQKVISDIREYFKKQLGVELLLFTTDAARSNLRYEVLYRNDEEKYTTLRSLIEQKDCPTICYASRTKRVEDIAKRLCGDGFCARAFYGKMPTEEKIANQDAFLKGEVKIMVATSAFGMGVDKKDVGLVIHYDISDSLENYVQEAGRAGRDEHIQADCYVLFNEHDLDKHFMLLNQTKLSFHEIQQMWKGVKELTARRERVYCTALELARKAGWEESGRNIETKVTTAIAALETAGYIEREQNCPRVYADSIRVKTAKDAEGMIRNSGRFDEKQKQDALRIIKKLISCRSRASADAGEAESRVDYIADNLGIGTREVIEAVNLMKEEGILGNEMEMSVFVEAENQRGSAREKELNRYIQVEEFLLKKLNLDGLCMDYKELNQEALDSGVDASTISRLKLIKYFWLSRQYMDRPKEEISGQALFLPHQDVGELSERFEKRKRICDFTLRYFLRRAGEVAGTQRNRTNAEAEQHGRSKEEDRKTKREYLEIPFSMLELGRAYDEEPKWTEEPPVRQEEVAEALFYLSKTNVLRIEGGFLVLYNTMHIKRLEKDNKIQYKKADYLQLQEFYVGRTKQIHIVGEYANMMVHDYKAALTYVSDYFSMDYQQFLNKYFRGIRQDEIERSMTPMLYQKLFEGLSEKQQTILKDDQSRVIVVAAGPGSGKTKLLVHKLASIVNLEDTKQEQLLMLTFSRAAAAEFRTRLRNLLENNAVYIEMKTFHSYCFDLLGRVGSLEKSENVVCDAVKMLQDGEVETDRVTKTVLVLDEAQDMNADEYNLVQVLMQRNEGMRVIAVGDDDQSIYGFREADAKYLAALSQLPEAHFYELTENYRSCEKIVGMANLFARSMQRRLKSEDIFAASRDKGEVMVTKTLSNSAWTAFRYIKGTWCADGKETAAVLTITNEQAYLMETLLRQQGYHAKLIQSEEKVGLQNLAEVRYFVEQLGQSGVPVIDEARWEEALKQLEKTYAESALLTNCLELLKQFAEERQDRVKYFFDLQEYLKEVHLGDFYSVKQHEICISTVHKAKGREFDRVYLILDKISGKPEERDQEMRKIYVGMTRAKKGLYVFHRGDCPYFTNLMSGMKALNIPYYLDNKSNSELEEINLSLTWKDIWLDFSLDKKCAQQIEYLRSGETLHWREAGDVERPRLYFDRIYNGKAYPVAASSNGFYTNKYEVQRRKGYEIVQVRVLYVVWRHSNNDEKEGYVVLPLIRMRKKK
ncbi:MAG: RecQ family ATP-dependent DNA helicase [Lachnospiraceae bacterium]|nr:RecQ family ATP-dependent DNA helicase [Lachnospiraceae bacterium]